MDTGDQTHQALPLDFEAFVEHANEGMLVLDANRHVAYANQAFLDLMGYGDEVLGRDILDFLEMGNARKVQSEFDLRRTGARSHYEVKVQTGQGDWRTLHVASSPNVGPDGEFRGSFVIVNDLTDMIAMETQLQEYAQNLESMVQARTDALIASEERYHEVFEKVTDGILRVDRVGTILLCNQAFAEMVGASVGDVMGRNMMHLVHEEDRALVLETADKRLRGEPMPRTQIYRLVRLDSGEVVYIESSAIVTHREGAIDSIQIIARDVTERVLAEEELKRAYAELKGLSQAKTNFLSNVTHELKTPLVTVRGYTQMLHGETLGPVTDGQRSALGTALKNVDVLLAQIDRLLSVTRLELGDAGLTVEAVPVADFLRDCCRDSATLAEQKRIELRLGAVPADLPPLHADWVKLSEAIGYLVNNGIKFTEAGGLVELSAARSDGAVRLTVRDSGPGVEPERVEKLFEPFEQADGTSTRDYEGLGIGLALVRRVIEAHGGRFGVDSVLGEGSRFWCDIPVSTLAPAADAHRKGTPMTAMWDVNADHEAEVDDEDDDADFDATDIDLDEDYAAPVVFVDHDTDMLRVLKLAFDEANLAVDTITVPHEVLPYLRTTGARVVFLDVGLPGADGVDLCRQLKADPATAAIPVYVFTGHNKKDVRARAHAAGADGFIAKPVPLEYLLEVAGRH